MTSKPIIVFMLGDNVGWGDLGCFGGLVPTPRLDKLASECIRFTNFNTEAHCTPTRGALLTGRLPLRTGTYKVPLPGEPGHYGLSPWEYTIAELLSDAGYATACYGKWHVGNVAGRIPTDQGFDEWWGHQRELGRGRLHVAPDVPSRVQPTEDQSRGQGAAPPGGG